MTQQEIQETLAEISRRIAERFHPERIILFGSHARGMAGADSDADLLVIMNVSGSKRKQAVQIDLALEGIPLPTDVIVATPEEIEKYRHCQGTIIRQALLEGRVLYERAA